MEMRLKWSTPVFLAVAVAAVVISGQEPVTLDGNRTSVTHPFGSPLILKCNLNTTGYERMRVDWYFNPSGPSINGSRALCTEMYNRSSNTSTAVPDKRKVDHEDDIQILCNNISSATYNHSGWYFCQVTIEIPRLRKNVSAGTEVNITEIEEHSTHPSQPISTGTKATVSPTANFQLWHWILLGVSAFILVLLPVMCILLRRRCRRGRAEDPIYANTRPVLSKQPSPRLKMPVDTLRTASSSQNLRNPSPKRYEDGMRRHRQ